MNAWPHISLHFYEQVATIRLCLDDGGYITAPVVNALYDTLRSLQRQPGVRAVILTGEHPGTFITHYSLAEIHRVAAPTLALKPWLRGAFPLAIRTTMALARQWIRRDRQRPHEGRIDRWMRGTPVEGALLYARANRLIRTLRHYPLPVIAAIHGDAQGYGMELALACDFRLMARGRYRLGQIETLVGLIPGSGGIHHLVKLTGSAKAAELCLLGMRLDADQACQAGLVYRATDPDALEQTAHQLAQQLVQKSPTTLTAIKACLRDSESSSLALSLARSEPRFMDAACTPQSLACYTQQQQQLAEGKTSAQYLEHQSTLNLNDAAGPAR
tara:strand:- start:1532 stop:2518 length:987 start_codon:yes stop_codon:yes gene_type:complete